MRRALAVFLLLGFSFPLIAPLFTSGPDESALPACCRRNGRHHCMMAAMMENALSRSRVVTEKCPYAPFANVALMLPHAFRRHAAPMILGVVAAPAAAIREAEAGYRVSFDRARQKRGPPRLLSL